MSGVLGSAPTKFASSAEIGAQAESGKAIAPDELADALGFTKRFKSAEQTITSAGTLTLAHGLITKPNLITAHLVCKTANLGYSVGDEPEIANMENPATNNGCCIWADATNIYVQFGAAANVFAPPRRDPTVGQYTGITLASWKIVFKAWG